MQTLLTERLILRQPSECDAAWILAINQDPLWLKFIGNRGVHSLQDAYKYIRVCKKHFEQHGYGLLVIEDRLSGEVLGMCGLINRGLFEYPDLGYALLESSRGRGVALEAARAVVEWARSETTFPCLTAMTHQHNRASQKLLLALGYTCMGSVFIKEVFAQHLFWLQLR